MLGTLSTGLETFKADGRVGGGYPPSYSDDADGDGEVESPYGNLPDSNIPSRFEITGAGLLVWALAGADLQSPRLRRSQASRLAWLSK